VSRESQPVKLADRHSGLHVDAVLFDGISEENLREYNEEWIPKLREARERAKKLLSQGKPSAGLIEDAHWDWTSKVLQTRDSLAHKHFAIECESKTQGLMQVEMSMHRSRIEPGQHMVYVDYLSVAPWNRAPVVERPRFKLVGTILLAQAVGLSDNEGFFGRMGLHALPAAAEWYRNSIKMTSFGLDPNYEKLEYFELSQDSAKQFLAKMQTE